MENEKVFFIGDVFFKCVEFKPLEEPVSYKQIVDYSIFWKNSIEKVSFYFLSPTSFRRQGQQLLFPLPELIFGNLLNRWNQLSSFPFEKIDVEEFGRIMISQYNLSTEMIKFSNYKVIGFKGKVLYSFPRNLSADLILLIKTMILFAPYAGVGYKTSMGMGQVKVEYE